MFTFEIKPIDSTKNINNGTFLQTPFWCEFKSRHGWQYRRFLITTEIPPLNLQPFFFLPLMKYVFPRVTLSATI